MFRTIVALIFIILLGLGLYAYIRYQQVPNDINPGDPAAFAKAQPATCTFSGGSFDGSLSGTEYVANGNFRADYSGYVQGQLYSYHLIVHQDGSYGYWSDQENAPIVIVNANGENGAHCSPWWWPNGSVFVIPEGVQIRQQGSVL